MKPDDQEVRVDSRPPLLGPADEAFVARVTMAIARDRRRQRVLTAAVGVVCAVTLVLVSNLVIEVGTYVSGLPSTLAMVPRDISLSGWGAK